MRCVRPRSMRLHSALVIEARQEIVRKDPFGSFLPPVNRKGDDLVQKSEVSRVFAAPYLVGGKRRKRL
jgi:hypothetical protein